MTSNHVARSGYLRVEYKGMESKNLEKLLHSLSQSDYASLHLEGAFPLDVLEKPSEHPQLEEIYQATKLVELIPQVTVMTNGKKCSYSGLLVNLRKPPADLVLKIHSTWYRDKERIEVSEVGWDLGDGTEVRVRPNYFDIVYLTYKGKEEPSPISNVRNLLSGTDMRFERLNLDKQSKQ